MEKNKRREEGIISGNKEEIYRIIGILIKKYPKAFNRKEPKALKLGILEDIAKELEGEIGRTKIKKALKYYTNSIQYQQAILRDGSRVDLKGEEVSKITEEHRAYAQEQLGKKLLQKKRANKR